MSTGLNNVPFTPPWLSNKFSKIDGDTTNRIRIFTLPVQKMKKLGNLYKETLSSHQITFRVPLSSNVTCYNTTRFDKYLQQVLVKAQRKPLRHIGRSYSGLRSGIKMADKQFTLTNMKASASRASKVKYSCCHQWGGGGGTLETGGKDE